jgi:hypothetical protein
MPQGRAESASFNSAGGSFASTDGTLAVGVPGDAVGVPTTFTIQPITNTAPGGVGTGYRLLPEGLDFAPPVELTFKYTDADVAGSSPEALMVASRQADGAWRVADSTLDKSAKTVTAKVSHFSDWSLVRGFSLRPPSASVKTGTSQVLTLGYCYLPELGNDLAALAYDCADPKTLDIVPPGFAANWSVNGVAGGSAATGTVAGNSASATYTAPGQKPSNNPVAVSAEIAGAKGKVLVVSNITVTDGMPAYAGTVDWIEVDAERYESHADVTWQFNSELSASWQHPVYVASGTIHVNYRRGGAGSTCTAQFSVPIATGTGVLHVEGASHRFELESSLPPVLDLPCANPSGFEPMIVRVGSQGASSDGNVLAGSGAGIIPNNTINWDFRHVP